MTKTARIVMRMEAALKIAVMRAAADERQSMSTYVGELLHKHLSQTGIWSLPKSTGAGQPRALRTPETWLILPSKRLCSIQPRRVASKVIAHAR